MDIINWNAINILCPNGMKLFGDWIDNYKDDNNWDDLFQFAGGQAPKYDDLPEAMQIGIFIEFMWSTGSDHIYIPRNGFKDIIFDYLKKFEP